MPWNNAATQNLLIHRSLMGSEGLRFAADIDPEAYRDRVNLWVLAAGLLDAAKCPVVFAAAELDGAAQSSVIQFRDKYAPLTDNFSDMHSVKGILHDVVFNQPFYRDVENAAALIRVALDQHLAAV